ncbi:hypothetical protein MHTCC0001_11270 [Flavobacteriaceae bacterium MHTCC 0001]
MVLTTIGALFKIVHFEPGIISGQDQLLCFKYLRMVFLIILLKIGSTFMPENLLYQLYFKFTQK